MKREHGFIVPKFDTLTLTKNTVYELTKVEINDNGIMRLYFLDDNLNKSWFVTSIDCKNRPYSLYWWC